MVRRSSPSAFAPISAPGDDPLTPHDVYANGAEIIIPSWQHWAKAAKQKLDQMMAPDAETGAA